MGVAVSGWQLARAVSLEGQLGVVSGTAIDVVLARRLQLGDPGGHMQRALAEFPYGDMAERILRRYYIAGGKPASRPFRAAGVLPLEPSSEQLELVVAANFIEVFLAGEGHDGLVGVNYLEKIQPPTLASLYGAMLAGVDYVLMGAGIPRFIPGALDRLSRGEAAELPIPVAGATADEGAVVRFVPETFGPGPPPALKRPKFLAIVASATLASMLARKASGRVDGFIVEGPTAGGHNAPPRGEMTLNNRGEPVYGVRDEVDLAAMRSLGLPFWLAGSYGAPEHVAAALRQGAAGVQVGTAFAFCAESGLRDDVKRRVLEMSRRGDVDVLTDPAASPTGFPFKVLQMQGSLAEDAVYAERKRVCDLGFLRQYYRLEDGTLGWRCPAEPEEAYVRKGGDLADTVGRKCVCNALMANVGLAQVRRAGVELPLVTCGNEACHVDSFAGGTDSSYTARDVIARLLSGLDRPQSVATATAPLSAAADLALVAKAVPAVLN
ncbi:MAG: 2-nitropropane dioxygenase [Planctomycetota bacterium]|nr:MAG: 2-nitropropane dioxygenase [Planctomycetota bacterium]